MNRSGGEADAQKVVAENIAYFNTTRTAECGLNLFRHRNLHQLRRRAEFTNAFANLPRRTHADAQLRAGLQISCRLKLRADDYLVLIAGRLAKIIQLRPFRVRQLHALGQRPVQLGGNMVASVFGGPMCQPGAILYSSTTSNVSPTFTVFTFALMLNSTSPRTLSVGALAPVDPGTWNIVATNKSKGSRSIFTAEKYAELASIQQGQTRSFER